MNRFTTKHLRYCLFVAVLLPVFLCVSQGNAQTMLQPPTMAGATGPFAIPPTPNCQYVDGVYECTTFANTYNDTCAEAGVESFGLAITVNGPPPCYEGHEINIVTLSTCTPGQNTYCAVRTQNGTKYCWQQSSSLSLPIVPPSILTTLITAGMGLPANCLQYVTTQLTGQMTTTVATGNQQNVLNVCTQFYNGNASDYIGVTSTVCNQGQTTYTAP